MINKNKLKKYSVIAYHKILNNFQTFIYLKTGKFLPRPLKVYYLTTNKCNYKCKMCPQWLEGESENVVDYIETERIKELIDEMRKLKISEFGLSGGEPLLFMNELLELLEYANERKIYTHFVSNGKLLTKEVFERYNKMGGGHISLSIDAANIKHDELRGSKGAFSEIERVLSIYDKNKYPNIVLKINNVISNENLDEVVEVVELAIEKQAIIFVQPYDTYSYGFRDVKEKERRFPLWVSENNFGKLEKVVERLIKIKKKHPEILLNDKAHLKAFLGYFKDSKFHTKCYAALDQVTINPQGEVILCKYGSIGDLKKQSLKEFLEGEKRRDVVKSSLKCREGCLLGCMFRPGFIDLIKNGSKQFIKLIR